MLYTYAWLLLVVLEALRLLRLVAVHHRAAQHRADVARVASIKVGRATGRHALAVGVARARRGRRRVLVGEDGRRRRRGSTGDGPWTVGLRRPLSSSSPAIGSTVDAVVVRGDSCIDREHVWLLATSSRGDGRGNFQRTSLAACNTLANTPGIGSRLLPASMPQASNHPSMEYVRIATT